MPAVENKIVFTGPVGVGKTTAIASISGIAPVTTEARATDEVARVKSNTTVAMDFGVLELAPDLRVHLYGTPGQSRFDFMYPIIARGALGLVLLVDNRSADPLADLERYLNAFRAAVPEGQLVVGVARMEAKPRPGLYTYHTRLEQLGLQVPVFEVDPRSRADVKTLLLALLTRMDPGASR